MTEEQISLSKFPLGLTREEAKEKYHIRDFWINWHFCTHCELMKEEVDTITRDKRMHVCHSCFQSLLDRNEQR